MTTLRILPLLIIALVTSAASAGDCLSFRNYTAQGGALRQIGGLGFYEMISPKFSLCGDAPCRGDIDIIATVTDTGHVRNVFVTRNTYGPDGIADAGRAELLRRWFKTARFVPPKLSHKPVCVQRVWQFHFGDEASPS